MKTISTINGETRLYEYVFFGTKVLVYREDIIKEGWGLRNEVYWLAMCKKTNGGYGDHCLAEGYTKKEVMEKLNTYTKESFEKQLCQSETLSKDVETEVVIKEKGRLVLKEHTKKTLHYDSVTKKITNDAVGSIQVTNRLYLDGVWCGNLGIQKNAIDEIFKEDK